MMHRSEMILGKPQGKNRYRPVYIAGGGGKVLFYVGRPDGRGFRWCYRLAGTSEWIGNVRSLKAALMAGGDAYLRTGINYL